MTLLERPAPGLVGIALVPPDRDVYARLSGALQDRAHILTCDTEAALHAALQYASATLVVFAAPRGIASGAVPLVQRLHRRFPDVPIVVYGEWSSLDHRALVAIVKAGATELLRRGVDDGRTELRRLAELATLNSHLVRLEHRLSPVVHPDLFRCIRYGLRHPGAAGTLTTTARDLGMARRTLAVRLKLLGAPSPRRFFTWTRLLTAASLLAGGGRTLDAVAFQLGMSSGNGLRLLARRYGGPALPRRTQDPALLDGLASAFLQRLRPPGRLDPGPNQTLHAEGVVSEAVERVVPHDRQRRPEREGEWKSRDAEESTVGIEEIVDVTQ